MLLADHEFNFPEDRMTNAIRSRFAIMLSLNGICKSDVYELSRTDGNLLAVWNRFYEEWKSDKSDYCMRDFAFMYECYKYEEVKFTIWRTYAMWRFLMRSAVRIMRFTIPVTLVIGAYIYFN